MIKAILIDDEPHCLESLSLDLAKYCPEVEIIKMLSSSKDGLKYIKRANPDVLFLDIEMPWMNGFELLEYLSPIDFEVVFVTAYDSYAVNAFKVSAVDYLMKPVDRHDLKSAVDKVKAKLVSKNGNNDRIHSLLDQYFNSKTNQKIVFSEKDRQKFVDPNHIISVKAESNYSKVILEGQKPLTLSITLKAIEEKLEGMGFMRVHHSYLVNMNKVSQYVKSEGGYLVMSDNTIIPISRSKKPNLKTFLERDFN
ncbi:MAG: LytTR family DNA-binding domain-containing protein [Saprospiraceae bacterium]|nr:LytTR family DNA-binding domain-containing protein [Saprospiraceae bacterium]